MHSKLPNLHVEVFDFQGVLLDELAARFDVVAHEDFKQFRSAFGVVHGNLKQGSLRRVERRFSQLFGVHFSQPFESGNLQAAFSDLTNHRKERTQVFQPLSGFVSTQIIPRVFLTGAVNREERIDAEAQLLQFNQVVVNRSDFRQFDNVKPFVVILFRLFFRFLGWVL